MLWTGKSNTQIVVRLIAIMVFMFGFGYALVPLYDTFCIAFGLNGKTGTTSEFAAAAQGVDESRWVTVQFTSHTQVGLPWEFKPQQTTIKVRPGQVMDAVYFARNRGSRPIVGRATYSVSPSIAAVHFKKTECFCFQNQFLDVNEGREMPVRFVVGRDLPEDVQTVTLSYSFFNAEKHLSDDEKKKLVSSNVTATDPS